jgi:Tfp pilus assembly protein PilF
LFIAHPLHTEAIANIKGRDEIMCFMACIAAVYCIFKYMERNKVLWMITGAFLFFLGLMSKENAITFLAIIPITIFFFSKSNIKKTIYCTLPFIGVTAFYWVLRTTFAGGSSNVEITEVLNNPFVYMNVAQKYATIMFTLGKYLLLLVFPHPLTHDYYYNQIQTMEWSNLKVLLSLALYITLGIYGLVNIRKKSVIAYAIIFYLATLSIVSNIFFPIGTFMNERFLYFSSLGFCLALAYLLIKWLVPKTSKDFNPKTLMIVVGGILLAYSFKTVTRNEAWKDNMTLFTTDIKTSPNSVKLLNSVGGQTMEASDKEMDLVKRRAMLQESIGYLRKAVTIYPNYNIAWLLLGNAYFRLDNDFKDAIICYGNAIKINPDYIDAYTNIALAYRQLNMFPEAISANKNVLRYHPNDPQVYGAIADCFKQLNQPDSGIVYYNKMIAYDANNSNAYREIGTLYGQYKNDIDNALKYLTKAIELNPKDATAYENLGICYGFKKNFDSAIIQFNKALELNPTNLNLYKDIALSYKQKGNEQKAQMYFAKAQGK